MPCLTFAKYGDLGLPTACIRVKADLESVLTFTKYGNFGLSTAGGAVEADRMQGTLRVYGVQEPVAIATSMAINASNASPWAEGVRYWLPSLNREDTNVFDTFLFFLLIYSVFNTL